MRRRILGATMLPPVTVIARRRRHAHTTILAQRRRPPLLVLVPLAVGFFLAVAVDRAFGSPNATADTGALADPRATTTMQVQIGEPVIVQRAPAAPERAEPTSLRAAPGASTTRDAALERTLQKVLVDGRTPFAATVLLEASTGRVLAIAEHSTRGPSDGLALAPMAPAASVFKIVTASALLRAGTDANAKVCARGGARRLSAALLVDDPRRDRACTTLFDTLPLSQNTALAKLALKHLDPDALRAEAARFGFDAPLALDVPLAARPSTTVIPDDPFHFAEAAAGFGDVKLSALHGAVLAAVVANGGVLVGPRFLDDEPAVTPRRVLEARHAETLRRMMADTVSVGTARRQFGTAPRLRVSAAGKTGSLTDYATRLDTSWFVGFAPADRPRVAVASVVVNEGKWHVKAPWVAKEALRAFFDAEKKAERAVVARR